MDSLIEDSIHHRFIISFLDHGISITLTGPNQLFWDNYRSLTYWATQYPDTLECSEPIKEVILKSEAASRDILALNEEIMDLVTNDFSLFQAVTLLG